MNVVPFDRAASDEATPSISSGSQQPTRGSAGDLRKRIRSLAERGKVRAARFVCRNAAGHRAIAGCETMRVTRAWLHKEPAQEGGCLASLPTGWAWACPGNIIDAGNDQLFDRNSNGLATVTVDQVNRNTQYGYDSKGDVVSIIYEDTNEENYTYNGDAEPLTFTNANRYTTSYTYSSGNLTVVEDALTNLETMTYTSTGQVKTTTDANNHTTTYLYDSQDRERRCNFPTGRLTCTALTRRAM